MPKPQEAKKTFSLKVTRTILTGKSSIGELQINEEFFCYTLEDTDRQLELGVNKKVPGETAIPRGTYEVELRESPKFGWTLWIKDVPGYKWVLIHWGNKPEDTEGCILLGESYGTNWVSTSKKTFNKFMVLVNQAVEEGQTITLEVT